LTVVNFCFGSYDAPKDITGYLIPKSEGLDVCGVFLAGNVFSSHGDVINIVLAGEHEDPVAIAQGELKRMKMSAEPVEVNVRVCRDAIPMYYVGHREKVRRMREQLESNRFVLAGAAFDGIGIPNCIKSGVDAVVRLGIKSKN
jgi:protoporphyrinogen oxidase